MIYRILVDYRHYKFLADGGVLIVPPKDEGYPEEESLLGASFGNLAAVMWERRLKAPDLTHARARFYFTRVGWREVGRHVAAQARRDGHVVQVIRRKEPDRSQIVYRDEFQLALLPRNGGIAKKAGT